MLNTSLPRLLLLSALFLLPSHSFGGPTSLSTIHKFYKDVFQQGSVQIAPWQKHGEVRFPNSSDTFFSVLFKAGKGDAERSVGFARVKLTYGKYDVPDLWLDQIVVEPAFRKSNLAAKFAKASVEFLQSLSTSQGATFRLLAYTGVVDNTLNGAKAQEYGAAIWAPYGFQFDISDQNYIDEETSLKKNFKNWLETQYGSENPWSGISLDPEEMESAQQQIKGFSQPWQFYEFKVSQNLGRFEGALGKEFLGNLQEKPQWHGVLYVNRPHSGGMARFARKVQEKCGGNLR